MIEKKDTKDQVGGKKCEKIRAKRQVLTIARRNRKLEEKAWNMESKAKIKGSERKREEEIKRAARRSDSVMKSVSRHYFTHTDLIPRR